MPLGDDAATATTGVATGQEVPGDGPSVLHGSTANLAGLVVANALGVLMGVVAARVLGSVGVGVLAVAFGIAEFGRALSNFSHNPSILEYHRGKDPAVVFGTSLALKVAGAAAFTGIVIVLAPALEATFSVPAPVLVFASTVLFLGAFFEVGSARLEADGQMVRRTLLATVGPLVSFLLVVALALAGRFTVATSVMSTLLGTAAMSALFIAAWPGPWRLRWDAVVAGYLVRYGSAIVLATLLTQALIWTDTLMVSALLGNAQTGVYNVVFQMTFVMVTASLAIGVALVPAMSRLAGRGESTAAAYHRGTALALGLSGLLGVAYVAVGRPVLGLVYGPEFTAGYPALVILVVFGIAAALAVPANSVLMVHGHARTLMALSLVQALVNVPLNFALISRLGLVGAAVATTSVFTTGLLATWLIVRHRTGAWPLGAGVFGEVRHLVARGWGGRRR